MATVYLARDLKHERNVALKVLRPELAAVIGAERFLSEIKTTANLQHPNILPLFDSGEADGQLFYVMPFVEGESLRERIDREKQLPIADAIQIAREVAAALDYAHRQGVIHRDIKPENVLLKDGHALVADFGIALAVSAAGASRLTETGISLGTPHYMSPEQAAGDREITPRSDIYSLAAMLYEMLAGDPPFQGSTAQAIFAKVLTERPPLVSRARETIPRHVALAVHQGLARLPADRFPTANAFAEALVRPGMVHTDAFPLPEDERAAARRPATLPLSHPATYAVALIIVALAGLAAWGWLRAPAPARSVWIPVAFAPNEAILSGPGPSVTIAPDGSRIAYFGPGASVSQLWLWTLDGRRRDSIPGTAGAINPSFSPDGRSLAFDIATAGVLETVSLSGGPPRRITDSVSFFGDAWGPDGYIYFARTNGIPGISRISATGGTPEIVTTADTARGEVDHRWVSILPGGKAALFTAWRGSIDRADIAVVNLETKRVTVLFKGVFARYAASGQIVYAQNDRSLSAIPFDANALTVTGKSVPLIGSASVKNGGAADFTISANGTFAYLTGAAPVEELVWVTRDGRAEPIDTTFREAFSSLRLSPDARDIALSFPTAASEDLWTYDVATGARSRLTFDGNLNRRAEWSADGGTIMYVSDRGGSFTLWRIAADGGRAPERVLPPGNHDELQTSSMSADGRWIVYSRGPGRTGNLDLMVIAPGADTMAHPYVTDPAWGASPRISPDGHWVAYVSSESGRHEVYVRTLPASSGRWQISLDGGTEPVWSRAGNELFYRSDDDHLVAVSVATQPSFVVRSRRVLFSTAPYAPDYRRPLYDVSPDGQRFLMVKVLRGTPTPPDIGGSEDQLMLVLNWFQELTKAVAR